MTIIKNIMIQWIYWSNSHEMYVAHELKSAL